MKIKQASEDNEEIEANEDRPKLQESEENEDFEANEDRSKLQ